MDDRNQHGTTTFLDEEIDFDTLLEDDLGDEAPRRVLMPRRKEGGYKPTRIGRNANPNWSRIGAAAFVAIVFLFVVVFAVSSFLGHRKTVAFENYFERVGTITGQSDAVGKELQGLLDQPTGSDRAQLVGVLEKLEQRSDGLVDDARGIDAPEQMADGNTMLVLTLEYRRNGITMLRKALTAALASNDDKAAATAVAAANQRMAASDVIYADSYAGTARDVLKREEVTDVRVPSSEFVNDPEFTSPKALALVLGRLKSGSTKVGKDGKPVALNDGKVHGGQLMSVTVGGAELSTTVAADVAGGENLAFEVAFENQGEVQETKVPVTVTITGQSAEPQEVTGQIESVNPGEIATARVALETTPTFGEQQQVCIKVGPVPGEKTVDNNSACYQVTFSL